MTLSPHNAKLWAQNTFETAALGDTRRTHRLIEIAGRMAQSSGKSASLSCKGNSALLEATYRFIRNDNIHPDKIRRAGFEQTAKAVQDIPEILALEDTTSLSYKHQVATELGKLGQVKDKARGWLVHSTLLLDAKTTQTLGLAHQEWWCRPNDPKDADEKESGKWQAASEFCRAVLGEQMRKVIAVCDREADIFDYLENKQQHDERYVVRGKHRRKIEESSENLFDHLGSQAVLGEYQIIIPQKGMVGKNGKRFNRPERTAHLQVRSANVTFTKGKKTLNINAVWATEISPQGEEEALNWLLLTSEPVGTFDEAMKVIRIYTARWRVEDFHKAWKTGAGAERQRMTEPGNLERTVSILAFVGVRLLQLRESFTLPIYLTKQGLVEEAAACEKMKCDKVLSPIEIQLLVHIEKSKRQSKSKKKPLEEGTMQWAYMAVAKLGGFADTKRTGIAGWSTLWIGWEHLQERVQGLIMAKEMQKDGIDLQNL
jgi:hypothetical protein